MKGLGLRICMVATFKERESMQNTPPKLPQFIVQQLTQKQPRPESGASQN